MAFVDSKYLTSATEPPPRTLNVQKFAESRGPELESLHSIISSRLNNDFRTVRSKRRRTTGYDNRVTKNRRRKRRKSSEKIDEDEASEVKTDSGKIPRRVRRRLELKRNPHLGFSVSGDGTKRLRTHLWHAKRFEMTKQWGFYLPLGFQGRGRGSRALLKRLKSGTLIHDASYWCAVQLEGPEESLLAILRMVLVPSPSFSELSQSFFCGSCYGNAMLHRVGAPDSCFIAPVNYMWLPLFRDQVKTDPIANGQSTCEESECSTSFRQVWVWMHAAAFDDGFNVLSYACQKRGSEDGVSIRCLSLEGHLGKLEIMGLKALQVLQKILRPVSGVSNTSEDFQLRKCSVLRDDTNSHLQKMCILAHAEHLPSHAILSLTVQDPRDVKAVESTPVVNSCPVNNLLVNHDLKEFASLASGDSENSAEVISSLWSKPELNRIFSSDNAYLWASCDQIKSPMNESDLCTMKHQRRLAHFYLDNTKSGQSIAKTEEGPSRSCPIFLLKNDDNKTGSCTRWSIILPLSWVKAFWVPLISNGAQAIGLRERRWVSCDDGMPSFPYDFPDCKAYSKFMAAKAAVSDNAADLHPLAMRSSRIPVTPPWDCVRRTIEEGFNFWQGHQLIDKSTHGMETVPSSLFVSSDLGYQDGSSMENSFQGFVARTSDMLVSQLNEIHCGNLLLFPRTTLSKKCFSELMNKGRLGWALKRDKRLPSDQKLCFLRVILHSYREGSFEEGAVVCAPTLTDLSIWINRSEEEGGLHIPHSLVKSYFRQQQSGKLELQIPSDPVLRESHRWPIGFVTTGFVRGSTKPAAEGFCEATLLARLREEQWSEMQEKGRPEIFVLVRNLRSTAYRLALATIILERQHNDLEFM